MNNTENKITELSYEECQSINGGKPGDFLYGIAYGISWFCQKISNAAAESNAALVEAGTNNPVSIWQ
jgi:hypothetical protein